jgi:hypothetical protein
LVVDGRCASSAGTGRLPVVWNDYAGLPPFRRIDAPQHGLTDADVRRLLARGVLVRLAHGLLAGYRRPELACDAPQAVALRVQAMQRRYPIAVAGYRTAAALHELWLVGHVGPVHLVRARGWPREKHDVLVSTAALPAEHLCVVAGVAATTVGRTVVDLADALSGGEALAVADSALRAGLTTAALHSTAAELGYSSTGHLHRVLSMASADSQSALESMSRWLFYVSRIPRPEIQVLIGDGEGPFALVDFFWREHGVIGEADGLLKYDGAKDALREEKRRQERLERRGFTVVRWGFEDVVNHQAATVARVRSALARGEVRRRPAV